MRAVKLHAGSCEFCDHQGWRCFLVPIEGELGLVCDECDTWWEAPIAIGSSAFEWEEGWRWATRGEIEARGWGVYIVGEDHFHVNKFGTPISAEKAKAEERKRVKREQAKRESEA